MLQQYFVGSKTGPTRIYHFYNRSKTVSIP